MHTTAYWLTVTAEQFLTLPYSNTDRLNGLYGLAYALGKLSCVFLMCDRGAIGSAVDAGIDGTMFHPTIFLYDSYPGGIGLSRPLYEIRRELLDGTRQLIHSCPCDDGCPSCVGPGNAKEIALAIIDLLGNA